MYFPHRMISNSPKECNRDFMPRQSAQCDTAPKDSFGGVENGTQGIKKLSVRQIFAMLARRILQPQTHEAGLQDAPATLNCGKRLDNGRLNVLETRRDRSEETM
jgi:hypothetical protein